MLGDKILVAPVFSDDTALFYLPAGKWTWYVLRHHSLAPTNRLSSFWTEEVLEGPRWIKKTGYPFTQIPVYVRENTVLCLGPESTDIPDYDYATIGLQVKTYAIADGEEAVVEIPTGNGKEWAGKVKVIGGDVKAEGVKVLSL
jgi:alpha-glucosidase (family GH31 glycosyl hydrolase)